MDYELSNSQIRNLISVLTYMWENPEEAGNKLMELKEVLHNITAGRNLQDVQHHIIATISNMLKRFTSDTRYERKLKCVITEILKSLFDKTKVDNLNIFLFAYNFLLGEIYDAKKENNGITTNINEEYKLSIMQTVTSLLKALTWDAIKKVYTREEILTLSPIFFVVTEMAKKEQLRTLRIASIQCLMSLVKVDGTVDSSDIEIRNHLADVFMFFAPGIIQCLWKIATEDEIRGHAIALLAVQAWGKFVVLQMQDYNSIDNPISNQNFEFPVNPVNSLSQFPHAKWETKEEVQGYVNQSKRTPAWYKQTDNNLLALITGMVKLTHHSNQKVRLELTRSCLLLIEFCSTTIPGTISKGIEILIILSEDEDEEISKSSKAVLSRISEKFSSSVFKTLLENLEENFFGAISALPRVFNSLDEKEQLSSLNLLVGYLRLFGKTNLAHVLHSTTHLKRLIQTLIHFSELEKKDVSLYEEYMIQDLDLTPDYRTPWKNFRYFRANAIQTKLETICVLLTECNVLDITSDLLLDIFMTCEENRKEATLILNSVVSGISGTRSISDNLYIVKTIVNTYLDPEYWNLPLEVSYSCMLPQVKNNVVQICLQVEGLSKIALAIKGEFRQFLMKVLYPILERAGSGHPLIKAAGSTAIANVSVACGYANVTELINANSDYFSFHVVRKIQKAEHNESVLNVLAMVMKFSNINVLQHISDIISGVLLQTCDRFFQERNANAYLRVFQMFVKCLIRWLKIEVKIEPIKSKLQKKMEHENFYISNLNLNDDKDLDVGKTAEEMYKEDMEKKQKEMKEEHKEPQFEEYQKPDPPVHVQLTVWLLQRCLNFLPSKDRARKILVLEILKDGVEIIRDWEDSLLPLVHQIWSPLVDRFKEKDDSLVVKSSFQLLVTLARLAKDFIRSRVAKDILPQIKRTLIELSPLSYLKDTGSAYRYTQAYKLQVLILQQLARVLTDLDLADGYINDVMEVVVPYLSDKQPIPLQEASMGFFCDMAKFDRELVHLLLQKILYDEKIKTETLNYKKNVEAVLQSICDFP